MADSPAGSYGSLAQDARLKQLKTARVVMWIVGLLTLAVYGYLFMTAEKQVASEVDKELRKQGSSLVDVRRDGDPEKLKGFEVEYAKAVKKARMIFGVSAFLGIIFIGCALLVKSKPVVATVTALVLYVGSFFATLAIDPASAPKGIIIKVLVVACLVSALKAALAYEREQEQPATPR
jgi:hypothetical protein